MTSHALTSLQCLVCCCIIFTAAALPIQKSSFESRKAQIALLHMHDSVSFFKRLGTLTGDNKLRYAKRHSYDFISSTPKRTRGILKHIDCPSQIDITNSNGMIRGPDSDGHCWVDDDTFDIDHSRAPTFGKIKLALSSCNGRDNAWLFWSDADAMIINQTVKLETIIDDAYDIIYSVDWLMLNAGMILIKCSSWAKQFLENVYNARKFDNARALDQSALQSFIDKLNVQERNNHIKIIPKHAMDVYTEEYRPGDFLVHFAGKLYEATEPGLVAIANQFDILSLVDEIEDIEAFFRGRRLLNYYSGTCNCSTGGNLDCKPEDPRRIILKEPLGSISFPNRYRHVGLRYYWLGNWKDIYDVQGWDIFQRPLLRTDSNSNDVDQAPESQIRQGVPDPEDDNEADRTINKSNRKPKREGDGGVENDDDAEGDADGAPENNGDDDVDAAAKNEDEDNDGENDDGDKDDGTKVDREKDGDKDEDGEKVDNKNVDKESNDDDSVFTWHTGVLIIGCAFGLFGIYSTIRARKKMSSKTQ